jgi:hypothetical protein
MRETVRSNSIMAHLQQSSTGHGSFVSIVND